MGDRLMTFGKYKGQKVEDVLAKHPDYALWAHSNVRFFNLSAPEIQDCVSRSVTGGIGILSGGPRDDEDCGGHEYGGMSYSDFGNN